MKTNNHSSERQTFSVLLRKLGVTLFTAAFVFMFSFYIEPVREAHATPTPGEIGARITQITGLLPQEIDEIYAAEQAPNVLLIAYDITIPIMLEQRIGYLLIRHAQTGEWMRMIVYDFDEWKNDFRPYLESQGVTIHRQPYGTIDTTTPAAEAAAIAAGGSISGAINANLILYGNVAGPDDSIPFAPQPAGPAVPPLQNYPDIDRVGTTAGNFRVDESGAATYSVPIATGAGTASVAPQISLNYSSSAGNGIAGHGWSIGGLSAISRCRQTYDQDRSVTAVSFDTNDRFCLDGQRLLLTSAHAYGAAGSTYRTEIDSGAIVTIVTTANNEPDYFEVKRKDGSTSYYGKAPSSPDVSAKLSGGVGRTLTWSIRSFADSVGNPIWFLYDTSGGGQRIKEVRWAYGSASGPDSGFNARLIFDYETRLDEIAGYVDGILFKNDQRLSAIRSYNTVGTESLIRYYDLTYTNGLPGNDSLSRLTGVQECTEASCQAARSLPSTIFGWRYPSTVQSIQSLAAFALGGDVAAFTPADINGDGLMDIVWLRGGGNNKTLKYAFSTGSGYVTQDFATGLSGKVVTSDSSDPQLQAIDYNLDGRQDVAYYDGVNNRWKIVVAEPYANSSGEADWRLVGSDIITPLTSEQMSFVDVDSNGTTDAVYTTTNTSDKKVYLRRLVKNPAEASNPGSPTFYHFGSEVPIGGSGGNSTIGEIIAVNADFNGDGQVDIVMAGSELQCDEEDNCTTVRNRRALKFSAATATAPSISTYYNIPGSVFLVDGLPKINYPVMDELEALDINADGLTDLFYPVTLAAETSPRRRYELYINKGNGEFEQRVLEDSTLLADNANPRFVDWNMDGYQDLVWKAKVGSTSKIYVRLWQQREITVGQETINGFFDPATEVGSLSGWSGVESISYFDVNGDAVPDVVRFNKNGSAGSGEMLTRKTFTGAVANVGVNKIDKITNGLGADTVIEYQPLSTSAHYERLGVVTSPGVGQFCEDVNEPHGEWICYDQPIQVANKADFYEALNGEWGYPDSWQKLGKNSPIIEMSGPMYVVTKVIGDAPVAGATRGNIVATAKSSIEYYYGEAKIQAAGRGFLGFERLTTKDMQSKVLTTTRYRQDWPFIGMPIGTEVKALNEATGDETTLSSSTNEWEIVEWTGTTAATAAGSGTAELGPIHVVQAKSTDKTYDLVGGGTVAGTLVSDVTTGTTHNNEGYPLQIAVTTADTAGTLKTVTTNNLYNAPGFDAFEGRLSGTTVSTNYLGQTGTRASTFTYHSSGHKRGLLWTETVDTGTDPAAPPDIVTTHDYDLFGNRVQSRVASGTLTRCAVNTAKYDTTGRYVDDTFDCLGRKTSHVQSRNSYGSPTEVRTYLDAAAGRYVTTTTAYSVLGREYYQHSSDGASVTKYLATGSSMTSICPNSSVLKSVTQSAGGAESQVCSDKLGREVRTLTRGFDGLWDVQDTEYDQFGRVAHKSEPYDLGQTAFWTSIGYDKLGRPISATLPDSSSSTTSYSYVSSSQIPGLRRPGLRTVVTNDKGQPRTEVSNAVGETTDVIDANGGHTKFTYDALGNMRQMSDTASNLTTMTYDILGRKLTMDDPDKGYWEYKYNGFGELTWQKDARGQVQDMGYDGLGRMTSRADTLTDGGSCVGTISGCTGFATWVYDNSVNGLGQLASVEDSISNYRKDFSYDSKGRVVQVETEIDSAMYYEQTTYDQYGRIYQVFDATGEGVVHYYNPRGYLETVGDAVEVSGSPRTVYRRITAMNARGQVEVEQLSDGKVNTTNDYYDNTGRAKSIYSVDMDTGYKVQDLVYLWDTVGNLKQRKERSGTKNLTEDFEYEFERPSGIGLNRLAKYTVAGQTPVTMTYDAIGNILTKTDVSARAYQYSGPRPHAVTSAGGATYGYDANGNNTTGDGRTIYYTVFDKPSQITKGAFTIDFEYGPDRSRYKRTDSETGNGSTVTRYVGSVEFIDRADGTHERKRYLGGIAIETIRFGTNATEDSRETQYVFKDHLGSLDVVTDSEGVVVQEMSFDPWGQRRNAINWEAFPISALINFDHSITTRGFTGHEMLDEVGVVHMNGRIYDPKLGRFLQADPLVQDPMNTQSLNRYSYVFNNPLNATDPSGYFVSLLVGAILAFTNISVPALVAWTATAAFVETLVMGGNLTDALLSGLSAAAFAGLGAQFAGSAFGGWDMLGEVAAFGSLGGITSMMQGGKFGHGFRAAGLGAALGGAISIRSSFGQGLRGGGRAVAKVVVGGTLSEVSGGKFVNGAASSAFSVAVESISVSGAGVSDSEQTGGSVEEVVIAEEWEDPQVGPAPIRTTNAADAAKARRESSFEAAAVRGVSETEIERVLNDPVFQAEANRIWKSSIDESKGIRERGALRVFEEDGQYRVYSVGTPSSVANSMTIAPIDWSRGRPVFNWHPHPWGGSRPSPADLRTHFNNGIPGVIRYDQSSSGRVSRTIFRSTCKGGRTC